MALVEIEKVEQKDEKSVYSQVKKYLNKHHGGVAWRIEKHCQIIEKHLNPGEKVLYAFPGQKNDSWSDIFTTCVLCLTNKRILIGRKNIPYGYTLIAITPDLFNDLSVYSGLIWGKVIIDTVKEEVTISNIAKNALSEIETNITEYMMNEKKNYAVKNKK